jgi:hypothetical protein
VAGCAHGGHRAEACGVEGEGESRQIHDQAPEFARDFRVGFDKGGTARITWIKLKSIKKLRHVASELRVCKLQRAILNIP